MPNTAPGDLPEADETTHIVVPHGEYAINPLVPWRADPWCLKHTDGFYYFTGSVPSYDRIELMRAPSLRELAFAEPKAVWHKHASGPMSFHIWAPELHFIENKWYLYFAAGRAEDIWNIRMYVLENESPNPLQGAWIERGKIEANWDSFSLDATTFEHKGTRYLVWAQNDPAIKGNTNLYIAEMDTPWSIRGEQVRLTHPEFEWETRGFGVNEGAAILKRNGRILLSYSGSATDARYCMGLLWANENSDLLNPASWHKSPQPVFVSSEANGQYGPGHNSFTTSLDGSTDLLIYHARPYTQIVGDPLYDPNRQARVGVIRWDEQGMPVFGVPAPDGPLFFKIKNLPVRTNNGLLNDTGRKDIFAPYLYFSRGPNCSKMRCNWLKTSEFLPQITIRNQRVTTKIRLGNLSETF